MADDVLSRALQQLSGEIAQSDPYSGFGSIADQIGGVAVKGANMDNLGEAAAISLLGGLLGQGLGDLGRDYRNERQIEAEGILRRMELGLPATERDLLSEGLYGRTKDYGDIVRAARQKSLFDEQRKLQQDLKFDILKKEAGELAGLRYLPEKEKVRTQAALERSRGEREQRGEYVVPRGTSEAIVDEVDLRSPKFKAETDALSLFRKDVEDEPNVKAFQGVAEQHTKLQALLEQDTEMAEVAAINSFARLVSPGVVTENDFTSIRQAQPYLEEKIQGIRNLVTAEGRLTKEAKEAMSRAGASMYNALGGRYQSVIEGKSKAYKARGVPVEKEYFVPFEEFKIGSSKAEPPVETRTGSWTREQMLADLQRKRAGVQ